MRKIALTYINPKKKSLKARSATASKLKAKATREAKHVPGAGKPPQLAGNQYDPDKVKVAGGSMTYTSDQIKELLEKLAGSRSMRRINRIIKSKKGSYVYPPSHQMKEHTSKLRFRTNRTKELKRSIDAYESGEYLPPPKKIRKIHDDKLRRAVARERYMKNKVRISIKRRKVVK